MAFTKDQKTGIVTSFKKHDKDTGSPGVQVALITGRISYLAEHFKQHGKDFHSRIGLLKLVNRRRKLLDYIRKTSVSEYRALIKKLGIRK